MIPVGYWERVFVKECNQHIKSWRRLLGCGDGQLDVLYSAIIDVSTVKDNCFACDSNELDKDPAF